MCMDSVTNSNPKESDFPQGMTGYKSVLPVKEHKNLYAPTCFGADKYELGKWNEAKDCTSDYTGIITIPGDNRDKYPVGFHIWTEVTKLRENVDSVVAKVSFEDPISIGTQDKRVCIVAKRMRIDEVLSKALI